MKRRVISARASEPPDLASLRSRYLKAQLAGDRREALRLVIQEGLEQGASVLQIQLAVIQEAQREIGRLWQKNVISIAQEHMATAISSTAPSHLYDHASRVSSNGKTVMVACVEGELHDFPARLVADALYLAGFDVRYLGASVPTDSLVSMVVADPPHLLALSVTMTFNVPSLRDAVRRIRAEAQRVPIAVGGGACSFVTGVAGALDADVTAADAQELVDAAQRLLGITR
jgi:methanogenic corrinoid protein MtbC1